MKTIICIVFALLTVSSLLCQIDTTKYDAYIEQYSKSINQDFDSAFYYVQKAKDYAILTHYEDGHLRALYYEALATERLGNSQKALEIAESAIKKCKEFGDKKMEVRFLRFIGIRYKNLLKYDLAEDYFFLSLSKAKKLQDTSQISNSYFSLATLYETIGKHEKAINLYLKTLEIDISQGNKKAMAGTYNNMAILMNKMGNFEQGLEYINKAIEIDEFFNRRFNLILDYNTKASTFFISEMLDSCFHYYNKGLLLAKQLNHKSHIISSYFNLGSTYLKNKNYEDALNNFSEVELLADNHVKLPKILLGKGKTLFHLKRNKVAIEYLERAKNIISDNEELSVIEDLYYTLASSYKAIGDYSNGYNYLKQAYLLSDTIAQGKQSAIVLETEGKFQNKLKEQENQLLSQNLSIVEAENEREKVKNSRNRAYLLVSILALIIAISLIILFYRKNKQKSEFNKSLKNRINQLQLVSRDLVHRTNGQFTLATYFIQQKKRQAKKGNILSALQDTENWISSLSSINKHLIINNDNRFQNSLTEIVESLKLGAETLIEKKINTNLSIPSMVTTPKNTIYIGMIINELITNSIKYAFEQQENPTISIEINQLDDQALSIVYNDNGIGHKNHTSRGGNGMSIIDDLIEQLNGTYKKSIDNGFCFKAIFPSFLKGA